VGGRTASVYTLEHQAELAGLICESFAFQVYELGGNTIWAPAILHCVIQATVKVVTFDGPGAMFPLVCDERVVVHRADRLRIAREVLVLQEEHTRARDDAAEALEEGQREVRRWMGASAVLASLILLVPRLPARS
jgi:hypothetical protein